VERAHQAIGAIAVVVRLSRAVGQDQGDRRLRELEAENSRLKRLLANAMIDIDLMRAIQGKNW
jgi:hypothetical protein